MEGLGAEGHIHSFNSISQVPRWTTWEGLCVIFVWGGMSTGPLRQKYHPPFLTAFLPQKSPPQSPPALPIPDTSSLHSRWDNGCRGQCLRGLLPVRAARVAREEWKSTTLAAGRLVL